MEAVAAQTCFHCGEPVPAAGGHSTTIDGVARSMCCAACSAVASTIAGHGLTAYYATRSRLPACADIEAPSGDYAAYDLAEIQKPFVRDAGANRRQATLLIEGVTCGACVWLIEHALQRINGVRDVAVNLAARRLQVEWEEGRTRLSAILEAIGALGYRTRGFDPVARERLEAWERRALLWRLFVAGLAMMQVMMYALPAYISDGELTPHAEHLLRWAGLTLTVPVMLWSAAPFFAGAWRDLRRHRAGMDLPVALGLTVAFAASAWATLSGGGRVYFDSIAMFVFLLLGARYLEMQARSSATESQRRLVGYLPAVADRLVPGAGTGTVERVAVAQLVPGDLVQVAPGDTIPVDGEVVTGHTSVDESLLTGEARPLAKAPGDAVIGGSANIASPVTVRVARVGADTVLAAIVRLMDRAQAGRPALALLADRVAHYFVLALLLVSAATGALWYWMDAQRALEVMVAVLVVSCPCALSLATPAALTAATDALHRLGILVTRGHALETLARVTHVVFDKTGTLTRGRLSLVGVIPLGAAQGTECLALAAALERGAGHAIGRALVAAAGRLVLPAPVDIRNHPGRGVEAFIAGRRVRIGSVAFASELAGAPPRELVFMADDVIVVALADESGYLALFTLRDAPRVGARWLVHELEVAGTRIALLSGDRRETVAHVARELGIPVAVGQADPEAKLAFVRNLQAGGAVVAMMGDGVNDAPVLSQAQVSLAMAGGTDLAQTSADMVVLGDDLGRVSAAFATARQTMKIIRQNLAWAAGYNAIAVPLAMAGLVTPLAAGIGMALSSLVVVLNALRLRNPERGALGNAKWNLSIC